jgi:putative transcriptional regulator
VPAPIKRIRENTRRQPGSFSRLLNTSVSAMQKWETGQKRPTETTLQLSRLIRKKGLEVVV